jgi:hypothetical protein
MIFICLCEPSVWHTGFAVDCYSGERMTNSKRGGNIGLVIREVSATLTHKHRF